MSSTEQYTVQVHRDSEEDPLKQPPMREEVPTLGRKLIWAFCYWNCEDHVQWDTMCLNYVVWVAATAFAFALSPDSKFHRSILMMGVLHFAAETMLSSHLIYRPKVAWWISLFAIIGYTALAVVMIMIEKEESFKIFTFVFILSDSFSFLSSLACHMSPDTPPQLQNIAYAITLHWVGVGWAIGVVIIKRFRDPEPRFEGCGWATIGSIVVYQVYLFKDALQGKLNHLKPPSDFRAKAAQVYAPLISITLTVLLGLATYYGKQASDKNGNRYLFARAQTVQDYVMFVVFPVNAISFGVALFWYTLWHGKVHPYEQIPDKEKDERKQKQAGHGGQGTGSDDEDDDEI